MGAAWETEIVTIQKQAWQTEGPPVIGTLAKLPRASWPKADSSKCSIFEAVDLVGRALLGEDWNGDELLVTKWWLAPETAEKAHQEELERKAKLPRPLIQRHTITVPGIPGPISHISTYWAHKIRVQRAEAVSAEQARWEDNRERNSRLTTAVNWIATKCRDGLLQSYCRFMSGGKLMAMEAHEWNVDYPLSTFLDGGTFDRWFTQVSPPRQWSVYVFFDLHQLQCEIQSLANAPLTVAHTDLGRLSPYVQLAIKVALSNGYFSAEDDETQPVREAEIEAAWADALPDIPFSKTARDAIAKVIGFPNLEAIEQGKRALAKKGGVTPRSAVSRRFPEGSDPCSR